MTEAQVAFRSLGRGAAGGILATVALHGGLVGLIWYSQRVEAPRQEAPRELITTQLVKLGKPREKFWLPKIAQPVQRTRPVEAIKIADDPSAAPAPKEAPKPEDAQVSDKLRKALSRARFLQDTADEPDEDGQLDGSELGTATEKQIGDAYASAVNEAIRANWNVPVGLIADDELARLTATVRIQIQSDGAIQGEALHRPSGNRVFDDSCMQAIAATRRVPPPPAAVQAMWKRGVGIVFKR